MLLFLKKLVIKKLIKFKKKYCIEILHTHTHAEWHTTEP